MWDVQNDNKNQFTEYENTSWIKFVMMIIF